jgi:hypothetical protein
MQSQTPTGQIAWVLVASAVLLTVFAHFTAHLYRRGQDDADRSNRRRAPLCCANAG